jgi:hypothetical protein
MGLFARFACLRRDGTASDIAQTVRDLLTTRHVVEVPALAEADRLMMIALAGVGWLLLFDHVERPSEVLSDDDGLLGELNGSPDETAVDIIVADSDDLILSLMDGCRLQSQLEIGPHGLGGGPLEPWQRLLSPGKSIDDIRRAFAKRTTFVEEHFPALEPLFGIDLAAFNEISEVERGREKTAQGWGTRYLRAIADRMWLGPEFAAMLSDRTALERVAVVSQIGETLAIELQPDATLRDLELCLEPMLASPAESQAFRDRFPLRRPQ